MERYEARQDNRKDNRNAFREQRNERVETRNVAPETRQEFRGQREARTYSPAPAVTEHRDAREDRREGNPDWRADPRGANTDLPPARRPGSSTWAEGSRERKGSR